MHFESTPPFVDSQYSMRDYQIDGLNWLIRMYADGMNGILADEMGLGKTFQVISLLSYLNTYENIKGPHLIVCPKSVCRNWAEEFDKWVPGMFRVKLLEGEKEVRKAFVKQLQENPDSYDVIISSPELAVIEHAFLRKRKYIYTILDEAHRIKNANAKFTRKLKEIECDHSLLITGTPLQNNLDELWSLLNFISRDVFSDHEDFQYWLTNQSDENSAIEKLKMIISPFILRRIKMEVEKSLLPKKVRQVYTGLSAVQKKLYKDLLSNDIQLINDHKNAKNSASSLHNLLVQLRKCVNHPYIFRHIEPQPYVEGEHLIEVCGKLTVLDKLLKHWKANGDRVLIFSQMLGFLDIFEDYCIMRGYKYCRIDGATEHELRVSQIKEYNAPNSEKFIFLLSTKAAGQGINLATANIVVIYDLDWNPQVDLQAMDRAHRIGQKKQVYVYQFITEDSIEEKVLEKATKKLKLDQMVIQKKLVNTASTRVNASDMLTTVRHGAKEILEGEGKSSIKNDTIEEILAKSEARSQKFEQEMASVGYNELISLSEQSINLNDERSRHNVSIKNADRIFLAPGSRQRHRKEVNYSEISKPKVAPFDYSKHDYRFYPQELQVFYEKENDYYLKCYPDLIPSHILPGTPERTKIMQSRPLTDEEEVKKQEYIKQGFNSWSRKDYQLVIKTVKDPFL
jgi:SWI/SNF-related matrix-associated actin-dependent regulator of chromatin subfamily A member 5